MKFLYYFAITGWILGFIIHMTALVVDYDLTQVVPFTWLLSVGIFIAFIPAVLLLRQKDELQEFYNFYNFNQREFYTIVFKDTPVWLKGIAFAGMIYVFINFGLFMSSWQGSVQIKDNKYVLSNHGQITKTLTKKEYNHYLANETRGLSGSWIAFYGLAAAILYPFAKTAEE